MYIYQLRSPHTLLTYVGSTSNPLPVRYAMHVIKQHYWVTTQNPIYRCTAGRIIAAGDSDIVLLEDCSGKTKDEMLERENYYQLVTPYCVNKNQAKATHRCDICNCDTKNRSQHEKTKRHKRKVEA
jgi:hypothetical protein